MISHNNNNYKMSVQLDYVLWLVENALAIFDVSCRSWQYNNLRTLIWKGKELLMAAHLSIDNHVVGIPEPALQ